MAFFINSFTALTEFGSVVYSFCYAILTHSKEWFGMAKRQHGRSVGRYPGIQYPNDVSARFTDSQYEKLDRAAGRLDIAMAEILRRLVDDDLPKLVERERAKNRRAAARLKGQAG